MSKVLHAEVVNVDKVAMNCAGISYTEDKQLHTAVRILGPA